MRIIRLGQGSSFPSDFSPKHAGMRDQACINGSSILTLGNFDGVHRGHQSLLYQLLQQAQKLRLTQKNIYAGIILFEPHAREYFAREQGTELPPRLLSLKDKISVLHSAYMRRIMPCPLDFIALYACNKENIRRTAAQFVQHCLYRQLQMRYIITGKDFRFGAERQGSIETLRDYSKTYPFAISQIPDCTETFAAEENGQHLPKQRISSTNIRTLLRQGAIASANKLLGYAYFIQGRVIKGRQFGRTINTPTANIHYKQGTLALAGVYITWLYYKGKHYPAVTHIGYNQTLQPLPDRPQVETHLLQQNIHLYGAQVHIIFLRKLRNEQKFPNLEALKNAIEADKKAAESYFSCHQVEAAQQKSIIAD